MSFNDPLQIRYQKEEPNYQQQRKHCMPPSPGFISKNTSPSRVTRANAINDNYKAQLDRTINAEKIERREELTPLRV
jgi:hypothetical protein